MAEAMTTDADTWLADLMARDARWSDEQHVIYDWFERELGDLVVRARAGTGKTTTIIEGVMRARERDILLAAFNKEIATELGRRLVGSPAEAVTLHGLGFRFVKQNRRNVRVDKEFRRGLDLARAAAPNAPFPVLKIIRDLHGKAREIDPWLALASHIDEPRTIPALMNLSVRFNLLPDERQSALGWDVENVCKAAHRAMRQAMVQYDVIDFSDMIFLPIVHGWIVPSYDLVVVDEAQDMTIAQLALAVGARRPGGRMCVVGDDRQAIYSFRGADSGSLDRLKLELKAREVGLRTTYRCPKSVVALAAEIVPDFVAADTAPEGEIARMSIEKMILEAREGDFVLSRKNAPLVTICMQLLKRGVRATIRGNDVSKGILALIRTLDCSNVVLLLERLEVWRKGECERARRRLTEEAADERCAFVSDQAAVLVALADDMPEVDGRPAPIAQLERRCDELFRDDDTIPRVMCASVHRAKGLEADTVYLIESTFRHDSLEEDNIRYVAITRAKRRLVLVKD